MPTVSAQSLRDIVEEAIAQSISLHRGSRTVKDAQYSIPESLKPTDEEIDDFLFSNPLFDSETVNHLTDPGLLGFLANTAEASEAWLDDFRMQATEWAGTNEWLAADLIYYHAEDLYEIPISKQEIWRPDDQLLPSVGFLVHSPTHLLLADKLLREGRLLSEMGWRDFEHLIAELLESHGWNVTLMQGSKDGGIDVLAERTDSILGQLKAIWQAKKYGDTKKVQLRHLRELSAVIDRERATKGIIVTTSSLTRGAIEWVQKDTYRIEAKDGKYVENWVKNRLYGT